MVFDIFKNRKDNGKHDDGDDPCGNCGQNHKNDAESIMKEISKAVPNFQETFEDLIETVFKEEGIPFDYDHVQAFYQGLKLYNTNVSDIVIDAARSQLKNGRNASITASLAATAGSLAGTQLLLEKLK